MRGLRTQSQSGMEGSNVNTKCLAKVVFMVAALIPIMVLSQGTEPAQAQAKTPLGNVIIKLANLRSTIDGTYDITVDAGGQTKTSSIAVGANGLIERDFAFAINDDPFKWRVQVTPKSAVDSVALVLGGTVTLGNIVEAINSSQSAHTPYTFSEVQRPSRELEVLDTPVGMEFSDVKSASVAACATIVGYTGDDAADYKLTFDANSNGRNDVGEVASGMLYSYQNAWCTRHVTLISMSDEGPFVFELRYPDRSKFGKVASGTINLAKGVEDVSARTVDVGVSALSVQMFGARNAFEISLGNPFAATLDVIRPEMSEPTGTFFCSGSNSEECPDIPAPPGEATKPAEDQSFGQKSKDFLSRNRAYVPLAIAAAVVLVFVLFRRARRASE